MTRLRSEHGGAGATAPLAAPSQTRSVFGLPPAWVAAAVIGGLVTLYLWTTEGTTASFLLAASVCLAVAGALGLLTRSTLSAAVATGGLVVLFHQTSRFKSDETSMLLHAFDVIAAFSSPAAIGELVAAHPGYALALTGCAVATLLLALLALRWDQTPIRRWRAAGVMIIATAAACAAAVGKDTRPHTLYYFWNIHLSSFLASWPDAIGALARGRLIEAAPVAALPPFRAHEACTPAQKPPHIILIHQESVVPPSLFPKLGYDPALDVLFRSFDGKLRTLVVETYGGASWLSEFAVMSGLSARSFGGIRQLVQPVMAGKLGDALPQVLSRCGYHTAIYYPMLRSYLGAARFFMTIGFDAFVDAKDQGAMSASERDRFYHASAIEGFARHIAASRRPMFAYVQTTAAHWPYSFTYAPEETVPGGAPGTHPEMHEYLRRLALARADYAELKAQLAKRFPTERFLIVHYGDHQPTATRTLLGFDDDTDIEAIVRSAKPEAFVSFYAVDGVNFTPSAMPAVEVLDIPYLGTVLLEAAGLPLPESYQERRRLMEACQGRYFHCVRREEILAFHKRLIDSRLLGGLSP